MAGSGAKRKDRGKAGERAAPPEPQPQDVVVGSPAATRYGVVGRPRSDGLRPASPEAKEADREKRRRRGSIKVAQRKEIDGLLAVGRELIAREDHGAGRQGSPAAAFGTVTRAVRELHQMQREAYGIDGPGKAAPAVILLPVPASTVEAWAALAGGVLGVQQAAERPDPNKLRPAFRSVEDDVVGQPGEGDDQ